MLGWKLLLHESFLNNDREILFLDAGKFKEAI